MLLTSILLVAFPILMAWGLYDLSQAYWAKQRRRGPSYWQAILDNERRNHG
jgi:hypothetical protein